ncbi:hypothetical protein HK101_002385 [Irineochytrium annulatum]|nr:hypothetical protein HK101_002385 [Irineochytrium annulatum]
MPPKKAGKEKPKEKGLPKEKSKEGKGLGNGPPSALKAANSVKVRHILCEKHSKADEALAKLREGVAFNKVGFEDIH